MAALPLEGIRVLDFSWVLIGPQATAYLAAMGADVVRIESNTSPDIVRRLAPFKDGVEGLDRSAAFAAINGGKRSVLLNLAQPEAVEIAKQIVRHWQPHIVIENFVPGTMQRRGLSYEHLRAIKPDIIYASMSLLGQTGPDSWHRGWGPTMQARTGISWLAGHPHDGTPIALGGTFPDFGLAGLALVPILTALWHYWETGEGQYVDFAQNEGVAITISDALIDYAMNGRVHSMRGNRQPDLVPQGVYRCAGEDSWVAISVADDTEWASLCRVMGHPELADDPSFADSMRRAQHHDEIDHVIGEWTRQHASHEVQELLQAAGVAAGAALDIEGLVADPQLAAREFFIEMDHDEIGRSRYGGLPVRVSGVAPRAGKAPLFGQHTKEFFTEVVGLSDEELARLMKEQVIY